MRCEQVGLLVAELNGIVRLHSLCWDPDGFSRDIEAAVRYCALESDLSRSEIAGFLRAYGKWQLMNAVASIAEEGAE